MNNISISPRFFKTELNNYANHREALVRELIQNSVDSPGCRNIEIIHSPHFISVKDDGRGMSREILLTKYLSMGETTKEDGNSTGGFGKARTLTSWAQRSYEILSHDYKISGEGSGYEIENHEFTRGCEFRIYTDQEEWGGIIERYLKKCSFRQNITVNGEVFKSSISRGRWARDLSFGSVWVNKSANPILLVRVNGITMFSRQVSAAQIIIEINPEISREVLLSNRDSLKWEIQQEVDAFCEEIATESLSALKAKRKKFLQFAKEGKVLFSKKKQIKPELKFEIAEIRRESAFMKTPQVFSSEEGKLEEITLCSANYSNSYMVYEPKWYDPAMISLESESPALVKAAKFFDLSEVDESTTRIKLLKVWNIILDFVIAKYTERTGHEFSWGFGFVFSDDAAAQCKTYNNNVHYLLLNPVDGEGKIKFSINKKESLSEIISYAIHEVSHIHASSHNENFAQCQTLILIDVLKEINELFRLIKD